MATLETRRNQKTEILLKVREQQEQEQHDIDY